jgi:hypothetical protein
MQTLRTPGFLATLILAVLVVIGAFFVFNRPSDAVAGSLEGDYATTTTSSFASSTATTQLKYSAGALGNIVVSSSSPATTYAQFTLYDATSTQATTSARVLARFSPSSVATGTYIFDVAFSYGLKLEVPAGYNGNATITWR